MLCWIASIHHFEGNLSYLNLLSFTTIGAVLLNVIWFSIWVIIKHKKGMLVSFLLLLFSFNKTIAPLMGWKFFNRTNVVKIPVKANNTLKLITWNVGMFDLGDWELFPEKSEQFKAWIQSQNAHIVVLVEYYKDANNQTPFDKFMFENGYKFKVYQEEQTFRKSNLNIQLSRVDSISIGNVIFSKFPLSNHELLSLDSKGGHPAQKVQVHLNNEKVIDLVQVHLASFQFVKTDYQEVNDIKTAVKNNEATDKIAILKIADKINAGTSIRRIQSNQLASIIANNNRPTILCGDFNDVPTSYTYTTSKGALADAFVTNGKGLGRTFRRIAPTLRIDYIFYTPQYLNAVAADIQDVGLSDHNPVIATFKY